MPAVLHYYTRFCEGACDDGVRRFLLTCGAIGILFILLGGIMLVRSVRKGGHRLNLSMDSVRAYTDDPGNRRFMITLGLCVFYSMAMIGILPYYLGTGLFVLMFIGMLFIVLLG